MSRLVPAIVLLIAISCGLSNEAGALSCPPLTASDLPVFQQRKPADPRDAMLTTDPSDGEAVGYTDTAMIFHASSPTGTTCPTGSSLLLRLLNSKTGRHFYTASTTVRDAKIKDTMDAGWKDDGHLAACIVNTEDGMDEDKDHQECDRPLFRMTDRTPMPADAFTSDYTTKVRETLDCTNKGSGCVVEAIGRVGPQLLPYSVRTYTEDYQEILKGTKIKKIVDGDDEVTTVTIPFTFNFYGRDYTRVKVSTNGLLTFNPNDATNNAIDASAINMGIPDRRPPRNYIAGWWTDSVMTDDTYFLTSMQIEPDGHKRFIIQWGKMQWSQFGRPDVLREMQIHLFEASNRIEIHYGGYQLDPGKGLNTERATVGISDPYGIGDSRVGLACTPNCDRPDWKQGQVVAFTPGQAGYVVSEIHAANPTDTKDPDAYLPLSLADPNVKELKITPNGTGSLTLPFSFMFDGQRFNQVNVSTSGVMMFTRPAPYSGETPADIPPATGDRDRSSNTIAPWWDQLFVDPGKSGSVLYTTRLDPRGVPMFVVQWQGLSHFIETTDGGRTTHVDPSSRDLQVRLTQYTNEITIYYGETTFKDGSNFSFDHATAGIIGAEADGGPVSYRLLNCTPDCMEGERTRATVAHDVDPMTHWWMRAGGWPTYTKFVFTPDTEPRNDWHLIYRSYFMPTSLAPTGKPSAGRCGDCHFDLRAGEASLYGRMFNSFRFPDPVPTMMDPCHWQPYMPPEPTSGPMLSLSGSLVDAKNSMLVEANQTAVSWMTEPAGNFAASEANMPWSTWCPSGQVQGMPSTFNPVNENDEAKSRIRRWILQNTP